MTPSVDGHASGTPDALEALARDKMGLRSTDILDRTRRWLSGHQTKELENAAVAAAVLALLSRVAESFGTDSSVEPTEAKAAGNDHSSVEMTSSADSADAKEPSCISSKPSKRMKVEVDPMNGENGPAADDSVMGDDVPAAAVVEKKRRGLEKQGSSTNSTEATAEGEVFPPNADGIKNKESGVVANLAGIANELADFLAAKDDGKEQLTVAQAASKCLVIVDSDPNKRSRIEDLCKYLAECFSPDRVHREVLFKDCLDTTLQHIRISSKTAVECMSDFEHLWNACCDTKAFHRYLSTHNMITANGKPTESSINDNGKRNRDDADDTRLVSLDQIKECAWKLSCVTRLHQELAAYNTERKSGASKQDDSFAIETSMRRRKLVSIAACIGLMVSLPSESPSSKDTESNDCESEASKSEVMPRSSDEDDTKLINSSDDKSSEPEETEEDAPVPKDHVASASAGDEEDRSVERKRPSIENDAIAALSMMISGGSSAGSSPRSEPEDSGDTLDAILEAVNAIYGRLFASRGMIGGEISRGDLEEEMITTARSFAVPNGSPISVSPQSKNSSFQSRLHSTLLCGSEKAQLVDVKEVDDLFAKATNQLVAAVEEGLLLTSEASSDMIKYVPYVNESRLYSTPAAVFARLCSADLQEGVSGSKEAAAYVLCKKGDNSKSSDRDNPSSPAVVTVSSEEFVSSLKSTNGTTRIITVTDAMENNEWTISILSLSKIKPNTRLLLYLDASDDEIWNMNKRKRLGGRAQLGAGGWRDVMFPVIRRAVARMNGATKSKTSLAHKTDSGISISRENGEIVFDEEGVRSLEKSSRKELAADRKICKAVLALFYHGLETILYHETARLKSASHPGVVQSAQFHRALLACCYVCILKAVGSNGKELLGGPHKTFDIRSILHVTECTPYVYLKVCETFARALKPDRPSVGGKLRRPLIGNLPRSFHHHLGQSEVLVIDCLLWAHSNARHLEVEGGSVMHTISELKRVSSSSRKTCRPRWPPEILMPNMPEEFEDGPNLSSNNTTTDSQTMRQSEYAYLAYLLRKLLKISYFRISAFCDALKIPHECPIPTQVWVAFRYLLRHNIELLYDRHIDQLILCTLYGVCKIMKFKPELTFSQLIEVYTKVRGKEVGERECQKIVRHVRIQGGDGNSEEASSGQKLKKFGNVIQLYNQVYVPSMKSHLLQSKSLKKATSELETGMAAKRLSSGGTPTSTSKAEDVVNSASGPWTAVEEGNVKVNLLAPLPPGTFFSKVSRSFKAKPRSRVDKNPSEALAPKTRSFYSFGEASSKDLSLVNNMAYYLKT